METRRSTTGFWVALLLMGVFLVFSILLNIGLFIGMAARGGQSVSLPGSRALDEFPVVQEEWSYGAGKTKVLRLPIQGGIFRETGGGLFDPPVDKIEQLLGWIRVATADEDMDALILEIDSPGGAVSPSDELYRAIRLFRESREDRRVVMFTRDIAASGGYYAGVGADWIVAEPTALVGSIGVLISSLNWHGLSETLGVRDTTIKSGENKDLLNPFRETKSEQIDLLQTVVDGMHQRFRSIVETHRSLETEELDQLADGRVLLAEDALAEGLIDEVGYWEDALAATARFLEVDDIKVVRYSEERGFWDSFLAAHSPAMWLRNWVDARTVSPFLTLWKP